MLSVVRPGSRAAIRMLFAYAINLAHTLSGSECAFEPTARATLELVHGKYCVTGHFLPGTPATGWLGTRHGTDADSWAEVDDQSAEQQSGNSRNGKNSHGREACESRNNKNN